MSSQLPVFRSHPLVRGGHAQTLAGVYLPGHRHRYQARQHSITLDDGDQIVLHDDCPRHWQPADRSALLIHGLAGSHASGYMQRIAHKLAARGVRAFRMDLRGCGAGAGLAQLPYHSGRSEDAAAALAAIARWCPRSPTALVGFSLGANITLKLLGELGARPCGNLDRAVAVCPPVDLAACSRQIGQGANRLYDRHFVGLLRAQLDERRRLLPAAIDARPARPPRTLWEFDDTFTAVVCGFGSAENYYRAASSAQFIPRIELPTLIVASRDDPLIPPDALASIAAPPAVRVCWTDGGGHLGFIGRAASDLDRRWMDWRVVDWVRADAQAGRAALENSSALGK